VDSGAGRPLVVIFSGLPGTGKSTLSEHLARATRTPVFNGDWLMGALKPAHRAIASLSRADYLAAWSSLLHTLVTRQLMFGQNAIVDTIVTEAELAQWGELAAGYSARLCLIQCFCSDEATHRTRIEGRSRAIPGWHEVGWDHVERMRREAPPLRAAGLSLDAMNPLDENIDRVLAYIGDDEADLR
jgi:predicted kinase